MSSNARMLDGCATARSPVEEREAAFWDRVAGQIPEDELRVEELTGQPDPTLRLELLAPLSGLRVLDAGCGVGRWASRLAMGGAEVWAIDISPESCASARRAAVINEVADRVHVQEASAYELPFADGTFDAVHGENIVHHLDAGRFGAEVARVLKPGGRAVFSENSSRNKLLMLARDHICGRFGIPKWSSDDEYPLSESRLEEFGAAFSSYDVYYPEFLFAGLLNAKVFKYQNRHANMVLSGFDRWVARRVRWARAYSYRQMIVLTR